MVTNTVVSLLSSILLVTAPCRALDPIHLPLTFSNDRKYVLGAQMESQSVSMALSTSTGDFILAGADCSNCGNAPGLNISDLQDAVPLSGGVRNLTVLGNSVSGNLISHSCGLVQNNGSVWTYQNQTMIVANSSSGLPFSTQVSGIFGLGTVGYSGLLNDTVYGQWLLQHPEADNFTFGMALNPPKDSGDAGALHWLAPEPSAYTGNISWLSVSPQTSSDPTSELIVHLTEWDFTAPGIIMANTRGALAIIDPFQPEITIPNLAIQEITGDLHGVAVPGNDTVGFHLDCSTKMAFSVRLGNLKFTVDEKTLIGRYPNGTCYSLLVGWSDPSITTFMLGSSFISNTYLIFVVDRNGASTLGLGALASSGASGLSKGAIGGMTVAIIVAFFVALTLTWVFVKKRAHTARIRRNSRGYHSTIMRQPSTSSSVILLGPQNFQSVPQEAELDVFTPVSSNLPSPNPPPPTTPAAQGTVNMTIEHTVENLAVSQLASARAPSSVIHTDIGVLSPTSTDIFAIEPFDIAPPPYLAPRPRRRSVRNAIRDVKRMVLRSPGRGDSSWPDTP